VNLVASQGCIVLVKNASHFLSSLDLPLVRFQTAAAVALVAALVAILGIAIVYIPSFVSTVLKFRSGYFASLKGGEPFQQLRSNSNQVTTLLGNAFWGAAYSGFLAALLAGGIAFFALWSVSQQ
jgi:hypothetical protein